MSPSASGATSAAMSLTRGTSWPVAATGVEMYWDFGACNLTWPVSVKMGVELLVDVAMPGLPWPVLVKMGVEVLTIEGDMVTFGSLSTAGLKLALALCF